MLKSLSEEEFVKRTAGGARTPVFREYLADRETPVSVLTRVADDAAVFLLESVEGGESVGRYSYLGIDPYAMYEETAGWNPLPELRRYVTARPFTPAPELPGLQGGAIGYLAYDAVRAFVPRVGLVREKGTPTAAFLVTDTLVIFDAVRQTAIVSKVAGVENGDAHASYVQAMNALDAICRRLLSAESIARYMQTRTRPAHPSVSAFTPEMTAAEFEDIVRKCKDAIRAGEVIQIVPSQKFTAETDIPALALYRALRMVNPSPYNFFLRVGAKTLIGSSPEELVKLERGVASTCPIAGTKPRGRTPAEDAAHELELVGDPKERAEHVMLVDLGRNDLGRVCRTGTVNVEKYAAVERYSHVMHLVSTVTGRLADGMDGFDLLEAAFPAGTLSGAPKVRAMELLARYEKSPRGVYGGAAGYFSYTGDMDFAIVIRTMVLEGGKLTMRAGAGIVADSDPAKEYQETINKSKAIFAAAEFAATL
ncbi:MAG: anthranilate synthase component I family protein [Kiritimatiellae bacterium]|nr:anthranilate synthase component I family protein [Kiritimatiellia bacterium]